MGKEKPYHIRVLEEEPDEIYENGRLWVYHKDTPEGRGYYHEESDEFEVTPITPLKTVDYIVRRIMEGMKDE